MSRTTINSDALAAVYGIADGATILVGGFGMAGMPTRLIDSLIEQGATGSDDRQQQRGQRRHRPGRAAGGRPGEKGDLLVSRQTDSYVFNSLCRDTAGSPSKSCRRATWPSAWGRQARASARSSARPASAPLSPRARNCGPSTAATMCWSSRFAATSRSSEPTSGTGRETWCTARPPAISDL